MIELLTIDAPAHEAVQQVAFVEQLGRVVSFKLPPGGAVPETRAAPMLMIAATDLVLEPSGLSPDTGRIELRAGEVHLLSFGVTGLANVGASEARFTLIDLPSAK